MLRFLTSSLELLSIFNLFNKTSLSECSLLKSILNPFLGSLPKNIFSPILKSLTKFNSWCIIAIPLSVASLGPFISSFLPL